MTFVITNACIDVQDQSCIEVCPVDCIYFDEDDDRMCYVHPVECIDCAACESACPVGAIFADDEVPFDVQEFTAINARWFEDKHATRTRVNEIASGGLSIT
ncbi:MAG: ferredoxin family protein [Gammaproteobacteria bacterium]|nr:ferredoxin family protein [Gammaproteobacteria bacterium]MDE0364341.1 ferredoxin family protein [Gammaproteobacteria bacterium]